MYTCTTSSSSSYENPYHRRLYAFLPLDQQQQQQQQQDFPSLTQLVSNKDLSMRPRISRVISPTVGLFLSVRYFRRSVHPARNAIMLMNYNVTCYETILNCLIFCVTAEWTKINSYHCHTATAQCSDSPCYTKSLPLCPYLFLASRVSSFLLPLLLSQESSFTSSFFFTFRVFVRLGFVIRSSDSWSMTFILDFEFMISMNQERKRKTLFVVKALGGKTLSLHKSLLSSSPWSHPQVVTLTRSERKKWHELKSNDIRKKNHILCYYQIVSQDNTMWKSWCAPKRVLMRGRSTCPTRKPLIHLEFFRKKKPLIGKTRRRSST